jgi:bifunctional non-homologous end joining protein LigD
VRKALRAAARKLPALKTIEVQLAVLVERVPAGSEWLHEIKFDGYRLVCQVEGGKVKLMTRRHQDWTHRYPTIQEAAAKLKVRSVILDGELVALLPSGLSSFQGLQNAGRPGSTKLVYYTFDLLFHNGEDLRHLPLEERKSRLREILPAANDGSIRYSEQFDSHGAELFRESCQRGLEGIISKRRDRPYLAGRSGDWVKIKCVGREELVIGGFTLSTADRRGIGALLVGYFHNDQLIYAGRVGTGFTARMLVELRERLEKLRQPTCPFAAVPAKERGPNVKWVKPKLVAEFKFAAWTADAVLRQPSFQGLREDKAATEVHRPASLELAISQNPDASAKHGEGKRSRKKR